jgi:hypothetical protein
MIERLRVDVATVPLPGGRVVRLALRYTPAGEPEALTLSAGWRQERPAGLEAAHNVTVPADAMSGILDALNALLSDWEGGHTP